MAAGSCWNLLCRDALSSSCCWTSSAAEVIVIGLLWWSCCEKNARWGPTPPFPLGNVAFIACNPICQWERVWKVTGLSPSFSVLVTCSEINERTFLNGGGGRRAIVWPSVLLFCLMLLTLQFRKFKNRKVVLQWQFSRTKLPAQCGTYFSRVMLLKL